MPRPQSGNESAITNLENTAGNTGVEGLWVFEVRNGAIVGDITFAATEFDAPDLFGFVANFPNPDHLGDRPSKAGDLWINSANEDQFIPGTGPVYGHTSWNTYLHELGHALGLRHPNEAPNDDSTNAQYTVMSYVEHPSESGEALSDQAYSLTPMVWDIQAMQELYGANTTTRASDTVYFGDGGGSQGAAEYQYATNADNDLGMQVKGEDGTYRDVYLTIWDAGGQDLIDASDLSTRSLIDLRPGKYSTIGEETDNIAVAAAVRQDGAVINFIKDAWGGSARDRITGNNADNDLRGGDTFVFSGGDDRVRDFNTSRSDEVIDLSRVAAFTGFSDVMTNHASDETEGVMIRDLTGNSMLLEGLTMSELSAGYFPL